MEGIKIATNHVGRQLVVAHAQTVQQIDIAFAMFKERSITGSLVAADLFFTGYRIQIIILATRYGWRPKVYFGYFAINISTHEGCHVACQVCEIVESSLMRSSVLIAVSVVCVAIGLCAPASANAFDLLFGTRQLSQGAWCARTDTGAGRVDENCIFDSFEACRRTVISGNRGFCTQNPAFTGYPQHPIRKKKRVHSQ